LVTPPGSPGTRRRALRGPGSRALGGPGSRARYWIGGFGW